MNETLIRTVILPFGCAPAQGCTRLGAGAGAGPSAR